MFDTELVSKVVTLRGISGEEIIGTLLGLDEESNVYVLNQPRLVVINNNEVSLIPYLLTCDVESVPFNGDSIVTMLETSGTISREYQTMVANESKENSPVEAELVE